MLSRHRSKATLYLDKYIGAHLAKLGVSPNVVTAIALPLAIAAAYFIYLREWPLAWAFMAGSIVIDNLDGTVARCQNTASKWGSYFDAMMDKNVEALIYLGFAFNYPMLAFLAATMTLLNSYAKPALAIRIPLGNGDWPAIAERADRLLVLLLGSLIGVFYPIIAGYDTFALTLGVVTAMCFIGYMQRMFFAKRLITDFEKTGKKQMERR